MTREEAKDVFLNRGFIEVEGCRGRIFHADKWREACVIISEWLKEEPILDKIFCIVYPLSIMSTPELEHKAIMQIAEMLEPLRLPESEDKT